MVARGTASVILAALGGIAQVPDRQVAVPSQSTQPATGRLSPEVNRGSSRLTPEEQFVIDTVQLAVALPVSDSEDRLRVLATAADVVSTVDRPMAKRLWREGVRVESELIGVGQKPAVSMMASGQADCAVALSFVENLPPQAVFQAEQSLIGAVTSCPKQTTDAVSRKLDAGLEKNVIAPRALMAAIGAQGAKSRWSQNHFDLAFNSLPDPQTNGQEAENLATLYASMAGEVDKSSAEKAGVALLSWLGKTNATPSRSRAIKITQAAMLQTLGDEGLKRALESDVSANAAVEASRSTGISTPAAAKGTSVLEAMRNNGSDQSERLRGLPAAERARAAAAHGFATATSGDKPQASKYFDMAFSAADDAWDARAHENSRENNAVGVVQEVGEAAAQVDSVNALERAQKLRDPTAQAIAMLAIARVVAGRGLVHAEIPSRR